MATWELITVEGRPHYVQRANARGWLQHVVDISEPAWLLGVDEGAFAAQKQRVDDAWSALSFAYMAMDLPPTSAPAYRAGIAGAYGVPDVPADAQVSFGGASGAVMDAARQMFARAYPGQAPAADLAVWVRKHLTARGFATSGCPSPGEDGCPDFPQTVGVTAPCRRGPGDWNCGGVDAPLFGRQAVLPPLRMSLDIARRIAQAALATSPEAEISAAIRAGRPAALSAGGAPPTVAIPDAPGTTPPSPGGSPPPSLLPYDGPGVLARLGISCADWSGMSSVQRRAAITHLPYPAVDVDRVGQTVGLYCDASVVRPTDARGALAFLGLTCQQWGAIDARTRGALLRARGYADAAGIAAVIDASCAPVLLPTDPAQVLARVGLTCQRWTAMAGRDRRAALAGAGYSLAQQTSVAAAVDEYCPVAATPPADTTGGGYYPPDDRSGGYPPGTSPIPDSTTGGGASPGTGSGGATTTPGTDGSNPVTDAAGSVVAAATSSGIKTVLVTLLVGGGVVGAAYYGHKLYQESEAKK